MRLRNKFIIYYPILIIISYTTSGSANSVEAAKGESIFQKFCSACHTIGKGKLIGPDLKNITTRRDISWMKGFIQSPSSYITKGDETAQSLLKEYGVQMPDLGLQPKDVDAVISYLQMDKKPETTAIPGAYFSTLIIGIAGILFLTIIGLVAGRKKTEVRL